MSFDKISRKLILVIACLVLCQPARTFSQILSGIVVDNNGASIADVTVNIADLGRTTSTDSRGRFILYGIDRRTTYLLRFVRIGYDILSLNVTVSSDTTHLFVVLRSNFLTVNEVTITAKPQMSATANSSQSVSVLREGQLRQHVGSNVTSELGDLPGVSVVDGGPFSQKPVIRGLGNQRVVILEDGERHDYQSWDDDDSPGIDVLSLQRVEVVRGPNSVLYGSDALGGVVNFIHDDGMLGNSDSPGMRGEVVLNAISENTEGAAHVALAGTTSLGRYYSDLTVRDAGNTRTPKGIIPNSGATELNFEGAVSTQRSWGSLFLGYSRFDQDRDILLFGDNAGSGSPYQATVHDRLWLSYKSIPSTLYFSFHGVLQQNDGAEYEDDDDPVPENHLRLGALSLDGKVYYNGIENNSATVGVSMTAEQNATLGQEPVIPAYRQMTIAAFLFDDYKLKTVDVSVGARYDHRTLVTSDNAILNVVGQTRNYGAFTGSLGLLWHAFDNVSFGMDVGSGWRAPNVEELFIEGLQGGSLMYKLGNSHLLPEQSLSTDFLARITGSFLSGEISGYYNRINRYVYLGPTGQVDSASGIMKYSERQANATLTGLDARLSLRVLVRTSLTVGGDFLVDRNDDAGTWLPLTPANRVLFRVKTFLQSTPFIYQPYFSAAMHVLFDQNKVAPSEARTSGYTVFDVSFGSTVRLDEYPVTMDCQIHNLLNRAYHDNMSLFKAYAFEPGIGLLVSIRVPFILSR